MKGLGAESSYSRKLVSAKEKTLFLVSLKLGSRRLLAWMSNASKKAFRLFERQLVLTGQILQDHCRYSVCSVRVPFLLLSEQLVSTVDVSRIHAVHPDCFSFLAHFLVRFRGGFSCGFSGRFSGPIFVPIFSSIFRSFDRSSALLWVLGKTAQLESRAHAYALPKAVRPQSTRTSIAVALQHVTQNKNSRAREGPS